MTTCCLTQILSNLEHECSLLTQWTREMLFCTLTFNSKRSLSHIPILHIYAKILSPQFNFHKLGIFQLPSHSKWWSDVLPLLCLSWCCHIWRAFQRTWVIRISSASLIERSYTFKKYFSIEHLIDYSSGTCIHEWLSHASFSLMILYLNESCFIAILLAKVV